MTTAPFNVTIRTRPTPEQPSPYGIVMLIPQEAGVTAPVNELTEINDANVATQLGGATNMGRVWYTHIESRANVHIAVIPFDATSAETNGPTALNALLSSAQRARLSFSPDLILVPTYPGLVTGASAIVAAMETVCANASVLARGITDAYNPTGATTGTQAEVLAWAGANTGPHILCMGNDAMVGTATLPGSVLAAAHICQDAALHGVGSHPFNLSTPLTGVGDPVPVRVFDITDGSAEAEALADAFVTSIIIYDGSEYLWNGRLDTPTPGEPRTYFGNAVISDSMVKGARRALAPYYGQRATTGVLASMADHVQAALDQDFVTLGLVDSVDVFTPTLVGSTVTVEFEVGFHGFIEGIRLFADIFMQAP